MWIPLIWMKSTSGFLARCSKVHALPMPMINDPEMRNRVVQIVDDVLLGCKKDSLSPTVLAGWWD